MFIIHFNKNYNLHINLLTSLFNIEYYNYFSCFYCVENKSIMLGFAELYTMLGVLNKIYFA